MTTPTPEQRAREIRAKLFYNSQNNTWNIETFNELVALIAKADERDEALQREREFVARSVSSEDTLMWLYKQCCKERDDAVKENKELRQALTGRTVSCEACEQTAKERDSYKLEYESRAEWIAKMLPILGCENKDGFNCKDAHVEAQKLKEKSDELDKIRAAVLAKIGYATVTLNEVVQAMEKAEALDWLERNHYDARLLPRPIRKQIALPCVISDSTSPYIISAINEAKRKETK